VTKPKKERCRHYDNEKRVLCVLPKEIKHGFSELNIWKQILRMLVDIHIYRFLSCSFSAIFHIKTWLHAFQSKKAVDLLGKDTIYRFLNLFAYNW
jgi:hypothetical protein